jgi:hypothetical protein
MDKRISLAVLIAASFACAAGAQAQERRFERNRPHFATPHLVFDDRYHHNHYYPARGYVVEALPPGNLAIGFRGGQFWFHSGVWYQRSGPRYIVVQPPLGVMVPALPPGYTVVYYGGVPYYYANDVYYVQQPTGYEVAAPPPAAPPAPAPVAAAPTAPTPGAQAPAVWYYCDSAKGYYPYVSQCPEGWKSVPATPPAGPPR